MKNSHSEIIELLEKRRRREAARRRRWAGKRRGKWSSVSCSWSRRSSKSIGPPRILSNMELHFQCYRPFLANEETSSVDAPSPRVVTILPCTRTQLTTPIHQAVNLQDTCGTIALTHVAQRATSDTNLITRWRSWPRKNQQLYIHVYVYKQMHTRSPTATTTSFLSSSNAMWLNIADVRESKREIRSVLHTRQ